MFIKTRQGHLGKKEKAIDEETLCNCKIIRTYEICLKAPFITLIFFLIV